MTPIKPAPPAVVSNKPQPAPTLPSAPRPDVKASTPAWDDEPSYKPVPSYKPAPSYKSAPSIAVQPPPAPVVSTPTAPPNPPKLHISTDTKVTEDDMIGPVVRPFLFEPIMMFSYISIGYQLRPGFSAQTKEACQPFRRKTARSRSGSVYGDFRTSKDSCFFNEWKEINMDRASGHCQETGC